MVREIHKEDDFETGIIASLVEQCDHKEATSPEYDAELCLFPEGLLTFVITTQSEEWEKLRSAIGGDPSPTFLAEVAKSVSLRGTLSVLRDGVDLYGCRFRMVYFEPSSSRNPDLFKRFSQNQLTVIRQVEYSTKNRNSIDLVLFLNGLPIFTSELKNPATGQDVTDAVRQYRRDRNPKGEPFLAFGRCLAHFAVDWNQVQVTTKLEGLATYFIPFNRGWNGGAGNPPPLAIGGPKYATEYLWTQTWSKRSVLDLVQHFLHHEPTKSRRRSARVLGKLIFPRYHQIDAVRRLLGQAQQEGPGHNYLVQHSAGSGKSNTIAWLAHRLSQLMDNEDERIFNGIIVITDRKVLDKQLQKTVRTYERTRGLVATIDGTSTQLREALESGKQIIVTTLHKFPVIVNSIGDLAGQRFALLIDEAHSSQGGSMHQKMTKVLTADGEEGVERDYEDLIYDELAARGAQTNLSVFAFTATPKSKTLELFGRQRAEDGKFEAHSLYSMRQAIEEGFILDVLQNYTTYSTYWKLNKDQPEDPEVDSKKAKAILRRFVIEHPETIRQKVDVIMDHFVNHSIGRIGGRAKAMVVTSSRMNAVKFRLAIDAWLGEHGHDFGALVAFTDTISIEGKDYTETNMNGFPDSQTATKFDEDDNRILVVANKYQTGFDQPLLHTMYVDKRLGGVGAVQTLSRLNRVSPQKEETCVLDFANEPGVIQDSFQDYYERTELEGPSDPMTLYELKRDILEFDVYTEDDAEAFCRILLDEKKMHADLAAFLSSKVEHFVSHVDDEEKLGFRRMLREYYRGYGFLARVMPFTDQRLEEFYQFTRHIAKLLPVPGVPMPTFIQDFVNIDSFRLSRTSQGDIDLARGSSVLKPRTIDAPSSSAEEEFDALSAIIEALNGTYGTDLTDEHRLLLGNVLDTLQTDKGLESIFKANPPNTVRNEFASRLEAGMMSLVNSGQGIVDRFFHDDDFKDDLITMMLGEVQKTIHLTDRQRIENLLQAGESTAVEFKETFRWDVREEQRSKTIKQASIKTIAAFLNSPFGGHLLIGVNDDGDILGLTRDGYDTSDKAVLAVGNAIEDMLGLIHGPSCDIKAVAFDEDYIIQVKVVPSIVGPAYMKLGKRDKKAFFVRNGAQSRRLSDEDAERYVAGAFTLEEE